MNTLILRERSFLPTLRTALLAGVVAGSLDALGATIVYGPVLGTTPAAGIWRGVASTAFGKSALTGGTEFVVWGLLFHYTIATCFALGYFLLYPYLPFLWPRKWLNGVLYGVFVWLVMNRIVLPLFRGKTVPFRLFHSLRDMLILVLAIGLPIALIAAAWYGARVGTGRQQEGGRETVPFHDEK